METWKDVLGYEGIYSVSNLGRVRRDVSRTRAKAGSLMKLTITRRGYATVGLCRPELRPKSFRVHRLVWSGFHGPIPTGLVINHMDGDPGNNRLENLEAITSGENIIHAYRVLKQNPTGQKVTEAQVIEIRESRASGTKFRIIAGQYGVTEACIALITSGKTWKSAGGPITKSRAQRAKPQEVYARCGPDVVAEVIRRHGAGESTVVLAREFDVSKRTILNWCQGKTRQDRQQ